MVKRKQCADKHMHKQTSGKPTIKKQSPPPYRAALAYHCWPSLQAMHGLTQGHQEPTTLNLNLTESIWAGNVSLKKKGLFSTLIILHIII